MKIHWPSRARLSETSAPPHLTESLVMAGMSVVAAHLSAGDHAVLSTKLGVVIMAYALQLNVLRGLRCAERRGLAPSARREIVAVTAVRCAVSMLFAVALVLALPALLDHGVLRGLK